MTRAPIVLALLVFGGARLLAITSPALISELRQMQDSLAARRDAQVLTSLPTAWNIETPSKRYSVSTEPLHAILASKADQDSRLEQATTWIAHLAAELERSESGPPAGAAAGRKRLDEILARREFAAVRPPSAWELFRQRVSAWILELFRRIFQLAAQHPTAGAVVFWVVVAGAVGLLAIFVIGLWSGEPRLSSVNPAYQGPRVRNWQDWFIAARRACDSGDLRQAVHCAYWSGVAWLQESGALPSDRARTPREFLRIAKSRTDSAIARPLESLTQRLERTWYAGQPAALSDYRAAVESLEALGCKVD